ncbi:MAG TPA: prepilin peptidase [Terriglobia bacterium]|jgi:leader peptidase (prepilin peptidase)/N-methyltransferase|nr:prepilin peptidase [Terriglobia bacterium]
MAYFFVILFGLALGSFLNVCIARLPLGLSVVRPRSQCPRCHQPIRWYDNIPALSYFLLRGRCRDCGEPISLMYPVVEIVTATLLLAAFRIEGWGLQFVRDALLVMILIVLVFTDLTERRIPHRVTVPGILIGLAFSWFVPVDSRPLVQLLLRRGVALPPAVGSFAGALAGALAGGGLFYAVGQAFFYLGGRRKEYLGFGDVMLMLLVGVYLGVPLTLLTILLGSLLGSLVALPLEFLNPRFRHFQWPYGSFLGAAAVYVCLWGNTVLAAYLRWSGFAG